MARGRALPDNIVVVRPNGALTLPELLRTALGAKKGEQFYVQALKTEGGVKLVRVEMQWRVAKGDS